MSNLAFNANGDRLSQRRPRGIAGYSPANQTTRFVRALVRNHREQHSVNPYTPTKRKHPRHRR